MKKLWINFVVFLTSWEFVNSDDDFYTAAVVEYPLPTSTPYAIVTNAESMISDTLEEYLRLINDASESGADIVVFPEGCLNYIGIATRKLLIKHAVKVNDRDIHNSTAFDNHCDYSKKSAIISKVSLKSRQNRIYVLINVIEKVKSTMSAEKEENKYNLYSTNIVFDRNGCIISRYRKFNTKLDPLLNRTNVAEVQIFHTDFNVTFGHFTSLDIMSKYPSYIMVQYGIQHILHPTLWYSSTPFYTSLQLQQGYAYANNIVLLAAGANNLVTGLGGGGIFSAQNGPLVMYQPGQKIQQLMLSKVPKRPEEFSFHVERTNVVKRFNLKEMDEFFLSTIPVKKTEPLLNNKVQKVCAGRLCCELFVRFTAHSVPSSKLSYSYRFSIFADKESHMSGEEREAGEFHCAIVACTKDSTEKCGSRFSPSDDLVPSIKFNEIRMKMIVELNDLVDEDLMVMPSSIDFRLLPLSVSSFEFTTGEMFIENDKQYRKYTTTLHAETDTILTFGVLGRVFQLDELHADDDGVEVDIITHLLSSVTIGLILIFIIWRLCKIK